MVQVINRDGGLPVSGEREDPGQDDAGGKPCYHGFREIVSAFANELCIDRARVISSVSILPSEREKRKDQNDCFSSIYHWKAVLMNRKNVL